MRRSEHTINFILSSIILSVFSVVFLTITCFAAQNNNSTVPPRGIPPSTHPAVGPPGAPPDTISPIEAMGYGDFRGVIHAHSYMSHDSAGTASRIIQAAQTVGVQFILMTDHPSAYSVNHGLRGFHGGVFFLPGAELTSGDGCILGIDLKEDVRANDTQGIIDEIHRQGGVALFGHIEGIRDWDAVGWDGMEIYNAHYDAILDGKIDKTIALIPRLEKEPDRVWLSILDKPTLYLNAWDTALKKHRVTGVAANDSHENVVYNGIQLDTYERSYGLMNTHLFLMELNETEILKALKLGHAYVCFEVFSPCRGFSFTATDGKNIAIMGDEFTISKEATSSLNVSIPKEAKIQLLKDGKIIKESTEKSLSMNLSDPGVYRVEVYMQVGKKLQPWIYSNPIYVR